MIVMMMIFVLMAMDRKRNGVGRKDDEISNYKALHFT